MVEDNSEHFLFLFDDSLFVVPQPFYGTPKRYLTSLLEQWIEEKLWCWRNTSKLKQAMRLMISSYTTALTLINLRKPEIRILTEYYSWHCQLEHPLKKLSKTNNEMRRLSKENVVSAKPSSDRDYIIYEKCKPFEVSGVNPKNILGLSL